MQFNHRPHRLASLTLAIFEMALMTAANALADLSITDVSAKQRYPWNGLVDVTYTIVGDVSSMTQPSIIMTATDENTGLTYLAQTFLSPPPMTEGTHTVTWNPVADALHITSDRMRMTITIKDRFPLYCLIDVSGGSSAESYPVTYLDAVPSSGWTTEHKTDSIVMRWCPAGTYMMQGQRKVTLTKPFYIGIFQVTQQQYKNVMGENGSNGQEAHPKSQRYANIRGGVDYPTSREVDANSFAGKLIAKTGMSGFDLPTEAQWEYACRAGTITELSSGKGLNPVNVRALARVYEGSSSGQYGVVGCYKANPWGLYDMYGNGPEMCLDWHQDDVGTEDAIDPVGPESGVNRVTRGCGWSYPSSGSEYMPVGVSCYMSCTRGYTRKYDNWAAWFRICMNCSE